MPTATFPFSQTERGQAISLAYEVNHYSVHANPLEVATAPGLLAAATLTYSYSDARRFVRSISSEEGARFALAFRVADPVLGSDFKFWQLSASASKFFALPWNTRGVPWHHALALRVGQFRIHRQG